MESRVITWRQPLGDEACPYCFRWVLNLGLFAIRLHKWIGNDDLRARHDHPYWFITLVLWGSYLDVTEKGEELMRPGAIRFRRSTHQHSVKLVSKPCYTLLVSGPFWRQWGFWVNGKFLRREQYFKQFGHQCDHESE